MRENRKETKGAFKGTYKWKVIKVEYKVLRGIRIEKGAGLIIAIQSLASYTY
jgi:hypothetical protein